MASFKKKFLELHLVMKNSKTWVEILAKILTSFLCNKMVPTVKLSY